jgi:hypothetical protein
MLLAEHKNVIVEPNKYLFALPQTISACPGTKPTTRVQAGVGQARLHGADRDAGLEQYRCHPREDPAPPEDYFTQGIVQRHTLVFRFNTYIPLHEELDRRAVSALSVRSRKLSIVRTGQSLDG